MAIYEYSIVSDFSNGIDPSCLHVQIHDHGFTNPFIGLVINDDQVDVEFTGDLSVPDKEDLDTIIANHDPDTCQTESDIGFVIGGVGDVLSEGQSSTNSTTPQLKLRMTITDVPEGKYRIGWYYEYGGSNISSDFHGRVRIDDTTDIMEHRQEPKEAGDDQSSLACGFAYPDLTSGNHNIDIEYWSESASATVYIKNARLEIWRVL